MSPSAQKKLDERDSASRDHAPVASRVVRAPRFTLICGDAFDFVRCGSLNTPAYVARHMLLGDTRRVRVCTDPPYGTGAYPTDVDGGVVYHVLRALGDAQSISFFGFPELLVSWCARLGWHRPDEWITWWPSNAAAKAGGRHKLLPKWQECIAIFGDVPGALRLKRPREKDPKKYPYARAAELDVAFAREGDVWTDAAPGIAFHSKRRRHPNEKPESLLEKLVLLTSNEDDLVVDPFMGSGTTGVAALRLGRRFVGIEKDPKFFATAVARLREAA